MAAVPPSEYAAPPVDSAPTPPHSIEAEQAVIGGLLLDNKSWDDIADLINKHDFYVFNHGLFFEAISKLAERNEPYDVLTVSEALKSFAKGDPQQLTPYLITLAKDTPSAANIRAYAQIVRRESIRRKLISVATKIIENASKPNDTGGDKLVDEAEQNIFNLRQDKESLGGFQDLKTLSEKVFHDTKERAKHPNEITGVATGFRSIDKNTNGLQKGDLIIIAARPSIGKTSLALNIVEHVAIKGKKPAAIFSLEMPSEQLVNRFFASFGKINQGRLRTGQLNAEEWARMSEAHTTFWDAPIYIDDSPTLTPIELRSRVRRLKRERDDLSLVVVDYLQLMTMDSRTENRAVEIAGISRSLKALAKEINVPVIALSQLNRNPEARQTPKPQLSDLRESGAIEQDADIVAMLYREAKEEQDASPFGNKVVTLNVVKHRNGPTFNAQFTFLGQYTRFEGYFPEENLPAQYAPNAPQGSGNVVNSFDDMGD